MSDVRQLIDILFTFYRHLFFTTCFLYLLTLLRGGIGIVGKLDLDFKELSPVIQHRSPDILHPSYYFTIFPT